MKGYLDKEINNFIKSGGGLLLQGSNQELLRNIALDTAKKILCLNKCGCGNCSSCNIKDITTHPDLVILDSNKIGVKDVEEIIKKVSYVPSYSDCTVAVIIGTDRMSEQAQNKILKQMEDNENIRFICTTMTNTIIDTIVSRLYLLELKPLKYDEFLNGNEQLLGENTAIAYYASKGYPMSITDDELSFLKEFKEHVCKRDSKAIFSCLGLLKEKDSMSIMKKPSGYIQRLFNLIERIFYEFELIELECYEENEFAIISIDSIILYNKSEIFKILELTQDIKNKHVNGMLCEDDLFYYISLIA